MAEQYRTCKQLKEILGKHNFASKSTLTYCTSNSEKLMKRLLSRFFSWRKGLKDASKVLFGNDGATSAVVNSTSAPILSNTRQGAPPNKRRRVRGGGTLASGTRTDFSNGGSELSINPDEITAM
jgi:DNA excision repair protein ERCC-4